MIIITLYEGSVEMSRNIWKFFYLNSNKSLHSENFPYDIQVLSDYYVYIQQKTIFILSFTKRNASAKIR